MKARELIAMGIVTLTIVAANATLLLAEYAQATF